MATMMTRAINRLGIVTTVEVEETFSDDKEISDWAKESVYFMNEKNIIIGVGNNRFSAKNTATREQAIIISNRCFETL